MIAAVVALGVWWTSNTIAHHAIHRPPFRRGALNSLFGAVLTAATGVPQTAWRDRHLAHHAGRRPRVRWSGMLAVEMAIVSAIWILLAGRAPVFFVTGYLPGYVAGLTLCAMHGHFEHAGGTTSYYGRVYNLLLFNDGYHAEHHMFPSKHWRDLPGLRMHARTSAWPAPLRWLELGGLERLESIVLRSRVLQRWIVRVHERAFREALRDLRPSQGPPSPPAGTEVVIVGGGLFPRTAIVLHRVLPEARVTIVDANSEHLAIARRLLPTDVELRHERYDGAPCECDVLVLPLSFSGARDRVYDRPPAPTVVVHDWIWRKRGRSVVVSIVLLKRINVVHQWR